jgi:prepilin-type N-terminal cleavage/methylation domain-containing protein
MRKQKPILLFAEIGCRWSPLGSRISPRAGPRRRLLSRYGGFTIIELLFVIAIIGILSAVAIPYYNSYRERVKIATCILGIGVIQKTIIAYYYEKGTYPSSLAEVGMDSEKDPWGNSYQYVRIADTDANPSNNGNGNGGGNSDSGGSGNGGGGGNSGGSGGNSGGGGNNGGSGGNSGGGGNSDSGGSGNGSGTSGGSGNSGGNSGGTGKGGKSGGSAENGNRGGGVTAVAKAKVVATVAATVATAAAIAEVVATAAVTVAVAARFSVGRTITSTQ